MSRKAENKLAYAKHLFNLEKAENPNQCYCAYDDYGNHTIENYFDLDNPVDFYNKIYKCLKCGKNGIDHAPIACGSDQDHPVYNKENLRKIDNISIYHSYSGELSIWKKDVDYAIFDMYDRYVGIGCLIGIVKTTVSTACDNPAPPMDIDTPIFQMSDKSRVGSVLAVPIKLFE